MFKWLIDKIDCLTGVHDWSPEDLNEFTSNMDVGDEVTIRCKRCNIQIVTVEKLPNDKGLKWIPHVKEATIYEVHPDFTKEHGQKYDLSKFQEDNK